MKLMHSKKISKFLKLRIKERSREIKTQLNEFVKMKSVVGACRIFVMSTLVLSSLVFARMSLDYPLIQKVGISGDLRYTKEKQLTDALEPLIDGGLLTADLNLIRSYLESIPSIFSAKVSRRWPDGLDIQLVEQLPVARWGKYQFINHEGEIFDYPNSPDDWHDLPTLDGPDGSAEEIIAIYLRAKKILSKIGKNLVTLEMSILGQIRIILTEGSNLYLSRKSFLAELNRFVRLSDDRYFQALDVARVDLRYEHGVAVAFKNNDAISGFMGTDILYRVRKDG